MNNSEYRWYALNPFAVSVSEEYDEQKDLDLISLCKSIPDVLFQIFKSPQDRTTMILRVPKLYGKTVESLESFGSTLTNHPNRPRGVAPVVMRLNIFTTLALGKKSAYPLNKQNIVDRHIFSTFEKIPYGVFGLKLSHAKSSIISKQYESIRKRNNQSNDGKNTLKIDPYEKDSKSKSECTSFFYTELFYGVQNITDYAEYENFIPCFSEKKIRQPNCLVKKKQIKRSEKNHDRATDAYLKFITSKCKATPDIFSDADLLPFVRFSENPHSIGHDSAQTPTISNVFTPESAFDSIDEEFRE